MFSRFALPVFVISYCWLLFCNDGVGAHEGPDPRASWVFLGANAASQSFKSDLGPNLTIYGEPDFESSGNLAFVRLHGNEDYFVASDSWEQVKKSLPEGAFTISTWVSLDGPLADGGIVGAFQDNGDFEKGWLLGFQHDKFSFSLSSSGADDGDGKLTTIRGTTPIEFGKWYHLVAIYDGTKMQLWVNGKLEAESAEQSGLVLYPEDAKLAVGSYLDDNESFPMHGRLAKILIYDVAAKEAWVAHDFEHQKDLVSLPPAVDPSKSFSFLVRPFLQYATLDSIRVVCELNKPGKLTVRYGETSKFTESVEATSDDQLLHTAVIKGLKPQTGYYYQVIVEENGSDNKIRGEVLSFQTASQPSTPFAFTIIGDTQGNPQVNGELAKMAWALRPNFLIIPGDLVDKGPVKEQWIHEFFESMNPLFCRVPFYPVLGNHEMDANHYYRYMALPPPEYYYSFRYGNAVFFMLDSNKKLDSSSEQYLWLEKELQAIEELEKQGKSDIVWKFVSFHHPSYSSDEDDYGNLWKGKSTWGDTRIRELTKLFDRYKIDIVWNGHIHSYERTWPITAGEVSKQGTIYMITGGGGGGLEQAGPIRPPFQNNVRRGHHFVYAAINGQTLEMKSFDLEGRLFDTMTVTKGK
jgi:acid phosphatase type 7